VEPGHGKIHEIKKQINKSLFIINL